MRDLQELFPSAGEESLDQRARRLRAAAEVGIAALVASVWIGSSFWGALDTAFCRIYHVECRGWLRQKRFALVMLVVVLLFMAATVAVPDRCRASSSPAPTQLPFGLADVRRGRLRRSRWSPACCCCSPSCA